jgi:hypothetical protein
MTCHWVEHTVEFIDKGITINLQGLQPAPLSLTVVTAESFVK